MREYYINVHGRVYVGVSVSECPCAAWPSRCWSAQSQAACEHASFRVVSHMTPSPPSSACCSCWKVKKFDVAFALQRPGAFVGPARAHALYRGSYACVGIIDNINSCVEIVSELIMYCIVLYCLFLCEYNE